jgi:hypothetical protein
MSDYSSTKKPTQTQALSRDFNISRVLGLRSLNRGTQKTKKRIKRTVNPSALAIGTMEAALHRDISKSATAICELPKTGAQGFAVAR